MNRKLHFLHVLFYGLCIVAALWLHGNPFFTISAIIALIFVGTVNPFLKRNDNVWKQLIVLAFPAFAGIWIIYSILIKIPSHIFIVESLALAGISFFFNIHPKEKGYRLIICAVLLIYGALIPRVIYFYTLIPVIILIFSILYGTRIDALIKKPEDLTKAIQSRYELRYLFLHSFIVFIVGIYIFSLFPTKKTPGRDSFANIFFKDSDSIPTIGEWFLLDFHRQSLSGNDDSPGTVAPEDNENTGEVSSFGKGPGMELGHSGAGLENKSNQESPENIKKPLLPREEYSEIVGVNDQFRDSFSSIFEKIKISLSALLGVLKGPLGILGGLLVFLTLLINFAYPTFKKYILEIKKRKSCRKNYFKAKLIIEENPALCLKLCYFTVRSLLDIAGHPREKNLELFEYGESMKVIDPNLCKNVLAVFSLYSKMVYSPDPVSRFESKNAFEHLTELRKYLLINHKKEL